MEELIEELSFDATDLIQGMHFKLRREKKQMHLKLR